ncbi:MAG TPA: hypothetical protein VEG64_03130 [Candidatus Sulfotelmatobacter sp.]|nr:hypothetical protein [Candidatus Sulfotelmatobacter sp.]
MPFIAGRYHINPIVGAALEAARAAEAAQNRAVDQSDGFAYDDDQAAAPEKGPIHRVEIEAAELVPSSSSRAHSGFVARVHRRPAESSPAASAPAPAPETHVFSDHRDLVSFLRDEFAKDCAAKSRA